MEVTSFIEENLILNKPSNMSVDDCEPLPVWCGLLNNESPVLISCWKVTQEELEEIKKTGRVWVYVYGHTMPPIYPSGLYPFRET